MKSLPRISMIILAIFVALIGIGCSIGSPLPSPTKSLILPLLHKNHPQIQRMMKTYQPMYASPFDRAYNESLYLVRFNVANKPYAAVLDTGSCLTWLQNPSDSSLTRSETYDPTPCDNTCSDVPNHSCSPDSKQCLYELQYGDGSTSSGQIGTDNFYVQASPGGGAPTIPVPVTFGVRTDGTNSMSGVMGMARHPLGMVTAVGVYRFSVCFPKPPKMESFVRFGADAELVGKVTTFEHTLWLLYIKIRSITVAGVKLEHLTYRSRPGNWFIFDTGAYTTFLNRIAMDSVVRVVKDAVKAEPVTGPRRYELCYEAAHKSALKSLAFSFQLDGGNGGGSLDFDFKNLWIGFVDV